MLPSEYGQIIAAVNNVYCVLNKFFVGEQKEPVITKEGVERGVVGTGLDKREADPFTDYQKTFLDGLMQRCVNDRLGSICKDIQQLYGRPCSPSSISNDKIDNIIKSWLGTQNTVNDLDTSVENLRSRIKTLEDHENAHAKIIIDNSENIGVLIENDRVLVKRNADLIEDIGRVDKQLHLIAKRLKDLETLHKDTNTKR
jgi:chaperonin cofactor prefoldin